MPRLHELRVAAVVVVAIAAVALGGCDVGNRSGAGSTTDAGVGSGYGHAHVVKSTALFACRQACWADIPFNACATQRDQCLAKATTARDTVDCHQMSRTCRKERRHCLRSCNQPGNQPALAKPQPADPDADTDDEAGATAEP